VLGRSISASAFAKSAPFTSLAFAPQVSGAVKLVLALIAQSPPSEGAG